MRTAGEPFVEPADPERVAMHLEVPEQTARQSFLVDIIQSPGGVPRVVRAATSTGDQTLENLHVSLARSRVLASQSAEQSATHLASISKTLKLKKQ